VADAINGQEAIEIYRRDPEAFDLVLLDMIMPVMGGNECIRQLRAINPAVTAVLTTGFSSDTEIQDIMQEGWAGFIRKPYRIEALSRVIRDATERKRRRAGERER
jgi:CheY-like chemotaxis protein